ncbi:type II toxin-antitoxin system VapB family antitoxin [Agrococcus sp. KRD186]|jgi:hypothetical protein|uniref:type II toxin-antitoxin system VapB family antitoxin n=1 Tax=Agrococcus sp. KRD186 TaxID=2729730 RepID=UPI0019D1AA4F|nr:hypothetical protein [Agrococcus sp. KRD186]
MAAATLNPVKVDAEADRLATDAAHFLGRTKKDLVSVAIREYVEKHRNEIHEAIQESMRRLDGSNRAAVRMLTGFSDEELDDLGGVPEDEASGPR